MYLPLGISKIGILGKTAWFSGKTTFHWNNTPRYSGHNWREKVQKIKKFYIFVIELVKYWSIQIVCIRYNRAIKQLGILGKKA